VAKSKLVLVYVKIAVKFRGRDWFTILMPQIEQLGGLA
jgi:hypothetical protein